MVMTAPEALSAWPLFGLVVSTPRLTLRYATDADLHQLALFRRGRVLVPGEEPFDGESTFYSDSPFTVWKAVAGEWGARSRTTPEWWHLSFAVIVAGEIVGQQNITAIDFRRLRTVNSFSFLAREHRGQGLGREMRAAVLHLAFAGLGAQRAESDAFADNQASLAVSRSLGYEPNGTMLGTRPSGPATMIRNLLTRETWSANRRRDVQIEGLKPCLALLGLEDS